MNSIKSILFMLISIYFYFNLWLVAYASNTFSGLETQIHSGSNTTKIKKMQLALKDFGIYDWEIDWLYLSVERPFLDYQKSTWLIKNDWDYGAGYFWVKTLTALKEDYPNKFETIVDNYLKMDKPSTNVRYFYVTAYYSPLPWQNRYTTGSYAWDIRLNGWWKVWASGKRVFEWMLAAPRNYEYGTKIEFEWLWVWIVEDRGWAIVNAGERWHEYDRIDVWMWYWDEWLARALKWWKRKILWKVVPDTRELTIAFDRSPVTNYQWLKVDAENPNPDNVKQLQQLLSEVKVYSWAIDGDFNSVKEELVKYQVENNIISSKNDPHAWYFWNKTYAALREDFWWNVFKHRDNTLDEDVVLAQDIRDKLDKLHDKITLMINSKYWKNTLRAIKYRRDLRNIIDKQTKKVKTTLRKNQLKYLKSLI